MLVLGIALAGAVGAPTRYLVDGIVIERSKVGLPLGTLFINVSGSFVLGFLTGARAYHAFRRRRRRSSVPASAACTRRSRPSPTRSCGSPRKVRAAVGVARAVSRASSYLRSRPRSAWPSPRSESRIVGPAGAYPGPAYLAKTSRPQASKRDADAVRQRQRPFPHAQGGGGSERRERHRCETERERQRPIDVAEPRVHDRARTPRARPRARATCRARARTGMRNTFMKRGASKKPPLLPSNPDTTAATATTADDARPRRAAVVVGVRFGVVGSGAEAWLRADTRIPSPRRITSVASTSGPPAIHRVRVRAERGERQADDEAQAKDVAVDVTRTRVPRGSRARSRGSSRVAATRSRRSRARRGGGGAASRPRSRLCRTRRTRSRHRLRSGALRAGSAGPYPHSTARG